MPFELIDEGLDQITDRHPAEPLNRLAVALGLVAARKDLAEDLADLPFREDVHRDRVLEIENAVADIVRRLGQIGERMPHEGTVRANEPEFGPDAAKDLLLR